MVRMNGIFFLGNGGGRYVTARQLRRTAGFYIEVDGTRVYVDPGPGALVYSRLYNIPLEELDAIIVTHRHLEHYSDAEALIECMTHGASAKRSILVVPESVVNGDSVISQYHRSIVKELRIVSVGEEVEIKGLRFKMTKTQHSDEKGVGFVLTLRNDLKISYTSDGALTQEVTEAHKDSQIVIFNCLLDGSKGYTKQNADDYTKNFDDKELEKLMRKHMDTEQVVLFLEKYKPTLALLRHLGWPLLRKGDSVVAREIEERTGVRTIALKDGDFLDLDRLEIINKFKELR